MCRTRSSNDTNTAVRFYLRGKREKKKEKKKKGGKKCGKGRSHSFVARTRCYRCIKGGRTAKGGSSRAARESPIVKLIILVSE